ncbi:MAG: hypothetical protein DRO40_11780 [Thermoprotei archaeon]|nr:MAG: hypothetical protein DRO40_11780 [Thermoprotei archaeon]
MEWFVKVAGNIRLSSYALTLISIMVLTTLVIINISVLHGFYNLYDEITFPRNHVDSNIVVVSGYSMAPFTSVINVDSVEDRLKDIKGVKRIVFEVLSIASINGSSIVVRGLTHNDLEYLVDYEVVMGDDFSDNCMYCVWISRELANRYGLGVGDYVTVYSLFTSSPYVLRVRGILDLDEPYSYELIVPMGLARVIRGIGENKASIAIVSLEPGVDKSVVLKSFRVSTEKIGQVEKALIALKYSKEEISSSAYSSAAEFYMARLGLHRDVFLVVSISITILMTMGSYIVGNMIVLVNRDNLSILYTIGLPKYRIKAVIIMLILVMVIVLYPIVLYFSRYLHGVIGLRIIEYPLSRDIDLTQSFLAFLFTYIFTAIGVLAVDIVEEE